MARPCWRAQERRWAHNCGTHQGEEGILSGKKGGKKKEEAKKRIDDGNNYPFGSHVLKRRVHLSVCLHVLLLCCNEPFVSLHSLFFYCFSPLPLIFIITA